MAEVESSVLNTKVVIDTREPSGIFELAQFEATTNPKLEKLYVKREGLKCGDLKFNSLGAERKEIHDFIGSIHDGRIFHQAFNMSETYLQRYLLVSGNLSEINEVDLKGVYTTIADVEVRYGFKIMFFPNDEMLVHYFLMLCVKLTQDLKPIWVFRSKKPGIKDEQIEVVCGIYGCGQKKAKDLLLAFCSIQAIFNADVESLMKVKGIGIKLAEHVHEVSSKIFFE